MKKLVLSFAALSFCLANAQTILLSDDFETGSSPNWTLNGGSGTNQWIINNAYVGYVGIIPDTPNEPMTITGAPQSYYLHIHNTVVEGLGIYNANFDTGSTTDQSATQTASVSTLGLSNVNITYYYLCAGATGTSYGTVEYSTDNGGTWNVATTYSNVGAWTHDSIGNAAWDNQANLKFRFRWRNGSTGNDPAFSVDQIKIKADGSSSTITNVFVTDTSWCFNAQDSFNVTFMSSGTFNPGNIYSAELSDASGGFGTPTVIGALNSSLSGSLSILATIPLATPVGNGYRIRVSSSDPIVNSLDNGSNLVLHATPAVNAGTDQNVCQGTNVTLSGAGASTYTWDNGVTNNSPFLPNVGTTIYTVIGTDAFGCVGTDQVSVVVTNCAGIDEYGNVSALKIYPNPVVSTFQLSDNAHVKLVKITDLSGKTLMTYTASSNGYSMENLAEGTYFVVITTENSELTHKIVKQ